jgi:uncharacterized protein YqgV (UPF0045/DUF77 family)
MKLSIEISMYPLNETYIPLIKGFIDRMSQHKNLVVRVNTMSTQVFGEFDEVMSAFQQELKASFIDETKIMVVTKFFNGDLSA